MAVCPARNKKNSRLKLEQLNLAYRWVRPADTPAALAATEKRKEWLTKLKPPCKPGTSGAIDADIQLPSQHQQQKSLVDLLSAIDDDRVSEEEGEVRSNILTTNLWMDSRRNMRIMKAEIERLRQEAVELKLEKTAAVAQSDKDHAKITELERELELMKAGLARTHEDIDTRQEGIEDVTLVSNAQAEASCDLEVSATASPANKTYAHVGINTCASGEEVLSDEARNLQDTVFSRTHEIPSLHTRPPRIPPMQRTIGLSDAATSVSPNTISTILMSQLGGWSSMSSLIRQGVDISSSDVLAPQADASDTDLQRSALRELRYIHHSMNRLCSERESFLLNMSKSFAASHQRALDADAFASASEPLSWIARSGDTPARSYRTSGTSAHLLDDEIDRRHVGDELNTWKGKGKAKSRTEESNLVGCSYERSSRGEASDDARVARTHKRHRSPSEDAVDHTLPPRRRRVAAACHDFAC